MAFIKTVVELINKQLTDSFLNDKIFVNKSVIGICQLLPIKEDGRGIVLIPSYIDESGEAQYVGPEDNNDIIIYHRITGVGVGKGTVNKGYGDAKGYDVNVVRMSMVVFARRDRIKISNDDMILYLQANFPDAVELEYLKKLQLKACNINITDIILNDLQVFQEEFQNVEFFLKPEQYLIKVNYTLESAFDKKCFNNCQCN